MKTRNTITKLIIMTLAVMVAADLLPRNGLLQPVKAQTADGSVRFVSYASIGIVHGEKVRLSVGNTEESGGSVTLSFSFYLAHGSNASSSVPLYESELIKVPQREFRFSEVSRKDLDTEGEPETGRAQLLVILTMIAPAGSNADDFPASLEIIKDGVQSGETVTTDSKYRLVLLAAQRSKQMDAPIGFIPEHRFRYSFFYPKEEGDQPVSVQAYIYDSYGNLLKQTDPVVLRPGDFQVLDIYRNDLPAPGEDRTGRLQVREGVRVVSLDGSRPPVKLTISKEVVNNRTGSTSGGDYFTGTVTVSSDGF